MMKQYKNPTAEIVGAEAADVLRTSPLSVNDALGEIYGLNWDDLEQSE